MKISNATVPPKVYYGLHMCEGVAEYRDPGKEPYRIMIGEETIKNMDPTFQGRPVYVHHVDEVNLDNIQNEADGFVVDSFYNKFDGKHWVKFMIVSDRGHEAVAKGWKLSNAYLIKNTTVGGLWHGVEYAKEVTQGEYEHLAIVPNPRYEESIILTPEKFKEYNGQKEQELLRLANSKQEKKPMGLKFWKKEEVKNAGDLVDVSVTLPKSGKEMTVEACVALADEAELKLKNGYQCNGDEMVNVGDDKMTVNELVKKHMEMKSAMEESAKKEGVKENKEDEAKEDKDKVEDAKKNDESKDKKEEDKKENDEADGDEDEKKQNALFAETLKNAPFAAYEMEKSKNVQLLSEKAALGRERY